MKNPLALITYPFRKPLQTVTAVLALTARCVQVEARPNAILPARLPAATSETDALLRRDLSASFERPSVSLLKDCDSVQDVACGDDGPVVVCDTSSVSGHSNDAMLVDEGKGTVTKFGVGGLDAVRGVSKTAAGNTMTVGFSTGYSAVNGRVAVVSTQVPGQSPEVRAYYANGDTQLSAVIAVSVNGHDRQLSIGTTEVNDENRVLLALLNTDGTVDQAKSISRVASDGSSDGPVSGVALQALEDNRFLVIATDESATHDHIAISHVALNATEDGSFSMTHLGSWTIDTSRTEHVAASLSVNGTVAIYGDTNAFSSGYVKNPLKLSLVPNGDAFSVKATVWGSTYDTSFNGAIRIGNSSLVAGTGYNAFGSYTKGFVSDETFSNGATFGPLSGNINSGSTSDITSVKGFCALSSQRIFLVGDTQTDRSTYWDGYYGVGYGATVDATALNNADCQDGFDWASLSQSLTVQHPSVSLISKQGELVDCTLLEVPKPSSFSSSVTGIDRQQLCAAEGVPAPSPKVVPSPELTPSPSVTPEPSPDQHPEPSASTTTHPSITNEPSTGPIVPLTSSSPGQEQSDISTGQAVGIGVGAGTVISVVAIVAYCVGKKRSEELQEAVPVHPTLQMATVNEQESGPIARPATAEDIAKALANGQKKVPEATRVSNAQNDEVLDYA